MTRTTQQLLAVVERELNLRQMGYPAMVEAGRIDKAIADARIAEMQDVYDFIAFHNQPHAGGKPNAGAKKVGAGAFPLEILFQSAAARADFIDLIGTVPDGTAIGRILSAPVPA